MARRKLTMPPGGRYTSAGRITITVRDPETGQRLSHSKIKRDEPKTYADLAEANEGFRRVQEYLGGRTGETGLVTVRAFWQRWTDPDHFLWGRKRSRQSQMRLESATRKFIERYGDLPVEAVDESHVKAFMEAGGKPSNLNGLATMFADAISDNLRGSHPCKELSRTIDRAERLRRKATREEIGVPEASDVYAMLAQAETERYPSGLAAWLRVGVETGMRGGELDAMEWEFLDVQAGEYRIQRQWVDSLKEYGPPKHKSYRTIPIDAETMAVILAQPRVSRFVFLNLEGRPWTHATRDYWWRNAVGSDPSLRQLVGGRTMYNATRHFWASRAITVWKMRPFDAAQLYGHKDGGATLIEYYVRDNERLAIEAARQARSAAPVDIASRRKAA